jgi:hypothetical protein
MLAGARETSENLGYGIGRGCQHLTIEWLLDDNQR